VDCVLHLLGPTRQKRTWVKVGSRSQVAAMGFGFLAAAGLVSSCLAWLLSPQVTNGDCCNC
jgi:hypothetical protein